MEAHDKGAELFSASHPANQEEHDMNHKTKILAIALSSSAIAAAAIARSVLGISRNPSTAQQLVDTDTSGNRDSDGFGREVELKTYKDQLEQNLAGLTESLARLEEQRALVSKKDSLRREQYVQVDHLLACFKDAYLQGKIQGFPRMVFTQYYDQVQIEEMVQRLLDRRAELKGEASQSMQQIQQAIAQLNLRITETKRHIDNIPVYAALAVAGSQAGKSDLVRHALVSCLDSNHEYLAKKPALYAPEESKTTGIPAADVLSAAQFLSQRIPEVSHSQAGELPTVSELTAALRDIVHSRR